MRFSAMLLSSVTLVGCGEHEQLPSTDPRTVIGIEATLEKQDLVIEPFIVDPADHERILRLFEGGTIDPGPIAAWAHLGSIRITYTEGPPVSVALFRTSDDIGAYAIGSTYYRGSSDDAIIKAIKHCQRRTQD